MSRGGLVAAISGLVALAILGVSALLISPASLWRARTPGERILGHWKVISIQRGQGLPETPEKSNVEFKKNGEAIFVDGDTSTPTKFAITGDTLAILPPDTQTELKATLLFEDDWLILKFRDRTVKLRRSRWR